jgi:hypothetical protein
MGQAAYQDDIFNPSIGRISIAMEHAVKTGQKFDWIIIAPSWTVIIQDV